MGVMRNEEEEMKGDNNTNPKDYGLIVTNKAVAQLCGGLGFHSLTNSCLHAFSNILLQFILDLGKSATFHANLTSRSHSNLFDLLQAFKDLGLSSTSTHFLKRMSLFEENPFTNPIPRLPVTVLNKGFAQLGDLPGGKHIPHWLPAFPDPHTYVNSPSWISKKFDLRIDKGEQARQRRKAERSLLTLQQRLLSCADDGQGMGLDKKHLLVKEAFGPAIHAFKRDINNDDVHRRVMLASLPIKRRPVVQFKMKAGKKMLLQDLDIHIRSFVCEKRGSFVRDDDRDDKKRRAEFILRQSAIEYPQEVSQM